MKIAYDAKRLFNNNTGLGNYSRTMIDILCEYFPENEYHLYTPKIKNKEYGRLYQANKCCRIINKNSKLFGSLWRSALQSPQMQKDGIDIYHGLSNEITGGLGKRGIKSVVTIHDLAFITFPQMYKAIDRKIYDIKAKKACQNADLIISISKSTENDIIKYYNIAPEKIRTIYQPVNPVYYNKISTEEASRTIAKYNLPTDFMLYVGSINSRKNLLGIVKAMQIVGDNVIPLVVVGNGREYKQEVLNYIAANKMEKKIIFLGGKEITELQALYTMAKLFVYPSFYEGFGLPIVEAMLSDCPVLTSNISSLPEAAGPNSLLADPYSTESIALCMERGLFDTELRKSMIEKGYEYALENFSPKQQAAKVMDVYREIRCPR